MSTSPVTTIDEMEKELPYPEKLDKKAYERELERLQIELLVFYAL